MLEIVHEFQKHSKDFDFVFLKIVVKIRKTFIRIGTKENTDLAKKMELEIVKLQCLRYVG